MPSDIDVNDEIIHLYNSRDSAKELMFLNYKTIISDRIISLTMIVAFLNYFTITYFEPVLAFRLMDFTESPLLQGLMFSIISVGY